MRPFLLSLVLLTACGAPAVVAVPDAGGEGEPDAGRRVPDAGAVADAGSPDAGILVSGLPVLGNGSHELNKVDYSLVAGTADGLNQPRDVAINPAAPKEVWITSFADNAMVIIRDFGLPTETRVKKSGPGSFHFMPRPSALAFGSANRMTTVHEQDLPTESGAPGEYMGPTLWPTDATFEGGQVSHMDMLHNSHNAVGIAWDRANIYWVFDGGHNAITRYDFVNDHGPGGHDHTDGIISRCVQGEVSYVKGITAGMRLDQGSKLLYVSDPGNRRVVVLNTMMSGVETVLTPNYDGATQHLMSGMSLTTLVSATGSPLRRPSGLALRGALVYVADNETSKIFAFDLTGKLIDFLDLSPIVKTGGLMGLDFDAQGNLFAVDSVDSRVIKIAPKN